MQYLSFSKHAVSCFHRRTSVLSRQTTISYSRSQLASRDGHRQMLDEHLRVWSSREGSSAGTRMYSYSMECLTNCILANVGISRLQISLKFYSRCKGFCITFPAIYRSARSSSFRGRPFLGRLVTTPYLFHFWMMVLIVLTWILYLQGILRYPIPRLCSSTISLRIRCGNSFVFPMAWFCKICNENLTCIVHVIYHCWQCVARSDWLRNP